MVTNEGAIRYAMDWNKSYEQVQDLWHEANRLLHRPGCFNEEERQVLAKAVGCLPILLAIMKDRLDAGLDADEPTPRAGG